MSAEPLVSIGLPVRNGAPHLDGALRSIVDQSYENIEVILSDNGFDDATAEICRRYVDADPRISYWLQDPPLTAWQNFRWVFSASSGSYFMWAAHDDLRSHNYVETLVRGLRTRRKASLAFSDLIRFSDYSALPRTKTSYPFASDGLSYWQRMRKYLRSGCAEFYGLYRAEVLAEYDWPDIDFAPDIPLLIHASLWGELVYEPGATFYQWIPKQSKSPRMRARQNSYTELSTFRIARLASTCAQAAVAAEAKRGRRRSSVAALAMLYGTLRMSLWKTSLFQIAPPFVQRTWRRMKYGTPTPRIEL